MKYISRLVVLALMCASLTPCIAQRSPFDNTQHRLFSEGQSFFTEKNYSASTRYLEEYLKTNPDAESEELRQARQKAQQYPNKPHKHAALIKAWADGAEIQVWINDIEEI